LHPYRAYKTVYYHTAYGGIAETKYYHTDGFSTADKQLWCRTGDYVFQYYGVHKVQQELDVFYYCKAGTCLPEYAHRSAWYNKNWT
jgi:hypothetical protein